MTDAPDPDGRAPLPGALLASPQPETPMAGPAAAPSGTSSGTSGHAPSGTPAHSQGDAAASALRLKRVRNLDEVVLHREHRPPLYDSVCGRLSTGTAARKLGAGDDILAPGQRVCPYHFHHAQEAMFVILAGCGSLRAVVGAGLVDHFAGCCRGSIFGAGCSPRRATFLSFGAKKDGKESASIQYHGRIHVCGHDGGH